MAKPKSEQEREEERSREQRRREARERTGDTPEARAEHRRRVAEDDAQKAKERVGNGVIWS